MTNLECNVMNCANNKDNLCCKPNIQVSGPCACNPEQTCCSSFQEANGTAQASSAYSVPNVAIEILCSAKNCTFNTDERCHADHISVSSEGSYPDTESKTKCASFRFS